MTPPVRTRVRRALVEAEILAAIAFYRARGWSWVSVVGFLATKADWRRR